MKTIYISLVLFFSSLTFGQTITEDGFRLCYDVVSSTKSNSTFCLYAQDENHSLVELNLEGKVYRLLNPEINTDIYVDFSCECMKYKNTYTRGSISYELVTFSDDGVLLQGTLSVEGVFSKKKVFEVKRVVD